MEIHQLEYVVALERYRNFSQAASEINVSQSTFSEQIKKLEDELNVKLFTRSTRKVQITPAGKTFLDYAKRILLEIQKTRYSMNEYTDFLKGELRLGCLPYCSCLGITDVIGDFIQENAGIDISIFESNSDDLLEKLYDGKIDLAFISSPYRSSIDIDFYPIFKDKLVLFMSKNHRLSGKDRVPLKELAQEKVILTKASTSYNDKVIQAFYDEGFKPNIVIKTLFFETIRAFVEKDVGLTLIQSNTANFMRSPRTTIVNLKENITFITGLAVLKNNSSNLVKAFKNFLFERMPYVEEKST